VREKVSRSEHRLHELFMELMRVVSTWHVDPTDPARGIVRMAPAGLMPETVIDNLGMF